VQNLYGIDDICSLVHGCKFTINLPDGNDSKEKIIAFLGLHAIRRFMMYQQANYHIMKDSLDEFVEYK
jgi:hypothetical protein